ncbi:hypothetical protein ABVF61_25765 [Roseibium sp. HPY-6]|uniref:hypothetical protein n=1 Tax=Roseibium sp. HPY-6 TaxID=3229852 RepID=UPI0033904648
MKTNKAVWISGALSSGELSNKLGIRSKYYGHDWEEPTHIVPKEPEKVLRDMQRQSRGGDLQREDFPEACYVFDPERFSKTKDFFFLGGFAAVKGKLAEVLASVNLGTGGLTRVPVFEADKQTELPGPFYALTIAAREGTFCAAESVNLRSIFSMEQHGKELWRQFADGDDQIAVTPKALEDGPDLWVDPKLRSTLFLSETLIKAIRQAHMKEGYLRLSRCRVVR